MAADQPGLSSTTTSTSNGSELLLLAGAGDQTAFASFYDQFAGRVYGLVDRLVGNEGIAEEVTQEVFVEVWRTAARFDPTRGSAAAWVLTIARRRAIDRIRSEQAARDREYRDAVLGWRTQHRGDDAVNDHIATADVRDALRSLPEVQRQALVLAYFGGHTYREVALLLGAPLGTVKGRIRDGLFRLRDVLEVG